MQILRRFGIALIGLAWMVPNHYVPWVSAYNEGVSLLGLLLLGASCSGRTARPTAAGMPIVATVVMIVALIPFVQLAAHQLHFSGDAYVSFLYLAALSAAIAVGFRLTRENGHVLIEELSWAVLSAGLVSSVLAMLQSLQQTPLGLWMVDCPPDARPYANLAQPNNLGTLLGWSTIALLLLHERKRLGVLASSLSLLVLVLGLGLAQSRTALLFGPVTLIGFWALRRCVAFTTPMSAIALATLVQGAVSATWSFMQGALLLTPVLSLAERGTGSIRFGMWPRLFDALWMQPWTGFGWLQVGQAQMLSAEKRPPAIELWFHAHNLFLDLCLWVGLPLGLSLSAAVIYWLVSRWRRLSTVDAACAMFALLFFFIHCMLELPHHYAYFLIPAGLWIGQVEAATAQRAVRHGWFLAVGWLASLVVFAGIAQDYLRVEEEFRTMRFEIVGVGRPEVPGPRVEARFMSGIASYIDAVRLNEEPGMSPEALDTLRKVTQRFPYSGVMRRETIALALNGRTDEAAVMMNKLHYMHGDAEYKAAKRQIHDLRLERYPQLEELERKLP